jgi:hypothetical protein
MHIELLENYPLTEDRLEAYKKFYRVIRDHYPNLELVNQENQSHQFRQAAMEGERLMLTLDDDFVAELYLQLLHILEYIVDELHENDVLDDMLNDMSL